ncbi:MAG: VanZ family protein [Bacilli bacterium]
MSFNIKDLDHIRSLNLIPFEYSNNIGFKFHISEVINNLIIFIPFGIYLRMLTKSNSKIIGYGFIFSLCLEVMQFILMIGASDVTDIITNTLGVIIGVALYNLLLKLFKSNDKINKVITILASIATIGMILLLFLIVISNL